MNNMKKSDKTSNSQMGYDMGNTKIKINQGFNSHSMTYSFL